LSENVAMTRPLTILLTVLLAACGVSPHVRVERAPGNAAPTTARTQPAPARTATVTSADRHVVVRGDTLYSIAFRNGIDVRDLIAWNRLAAPFTIYPGQALTLRGASLSAASTPAPPERMAPSPVPAVAARRPASAALGAHAVAEDGGPARVESLDGAAPSIAARTTTGSVMPAPRQPGALIAAIGAPPAPPPAGTPRPSPGYRAPTTVAPPPPSSTRPVTTAPASSPPPATAATNTTATATLPSVPAAAVAAHSSTAATAGPAGTAPMAVLDNNAPTAYREGIRWRWPSSGNVIGRFVSGDPTQQGIDIAGRLGQPVVAVADGEVVYSGNGLLGYGEMIIVQHSPDYLSAYGHNQRRLLAEGTKVKAGQVIAEMGQRGSQVMLHFEVRRRGKPVDPLAYLPPR
jgi:lipoprotein NlpD